MNDDLPFGQWLKRRRQAQRHFDYFLRLAETNGP